MIRHSLGYGVLLFVLTGITAVAACWKPAVEPDALVFVSTQAGAPLQGTFHKFDADICLDPEHPDQPGRIKVTVDTASVDTRLPELDDALKGPDFLDSTQWPRATFVSDSIEPQGENHYKVRGKFTLRDVTRTIKVPFDYKPSVNGAAPRLEGSTTIKRLDYHVGQGEWSDTRWVGDDVELRFSVKLLDSATRT